MSPTTSSIAVSERGHERVLEVAAHERDLERRLVGATLALGVAGVGSGAITAGLVAIVVDVVKIVFHGGELADAAVLLLVLALLEVVVAIPPVAIWRRRKDLRAQLDALGSTRP